MKSNNPPSSYFKTQALLLMALSMLMHNQCAWSACPINDSFYTDVYKLTDEFETKLVCDASNNCVEQPDTTKPYIKHEYGTLFVNEGFILSGSRKITLRGLGVDMATLQAINGKPIEDLAGWTLIANASPYQCFARSSETYMLGDVPHVLISVKGSDGGAGGGSGVIINGKPTVSVFADQANASEAGPTSGRFLIKFDAPRKKRISVFYAITGTAKNGKDFNKIKGKVSIARGESSASVDILPIDDSDKESTENVTLKFKSSNTYKLNKSQKTATVSIADND